MHKALNSRINQAVVEKGIHHFWHPACDSNGLSLKKRTRVRSPAGIMIAIEACS